MTTVLAALFEHNLWANQIMLKRCAELSDEQLDSTTTGTYGTIRDTLLHLVGAEERYVTTLTSGPLLPLREQEPFPGFDDLIGANATSGKSLIEIANVAAPGVTLRGKRRNGGSYEYANTIVLTQAINHATEHRAHINTILTSLDIEPLDLDGWMYGEAHGLISITDPPSESSS